MIARVARVCSMVAALAAALSVLGCGTEECPTCGASDAKPADAGADANDETPGETGCSAKNACGGCAPIDVGIGTCCGPNLCIKCQGTETFRCTSCPDAGCS